MTGGITALIGAKLLGPRLGKYTAGGEPVGIPGHSVVLTVLGTFVLAFGWFGFNAGSTLSAMDTRLAVVALNTLLASAAGAVTATLYVWRRFGQPDVTWMCNGMLAGMVAITAPCAFVSTHAALLIGAIAGVLVVLAALFIEGTLKIDDPVGASAVHLANGTWGIVALGLFADGSYGDGTNGVTGAVRGAAPRRHGTAVGAADRHRRQPLLRGRLFGVLSVARRSSLQQSRLVARGDPGLDLPEMGIEGYSFEYRGLSSSRAHRG